VHQGWQRPKVRPTRGLARTVQRSDTIADKIGLRIGGRRKKQQASAPSFPHESWPQSSNPFVFLKCVIVPSRFSGQRYAIVERIVSATEFRENADECMDWARTARSDRERAIFLQMAETWLQAAALLESRGQYVQSELSIMEKST